MAASCIQYMQQTMPLEKPKTWLYREVETCAA